MPVLNDAGNLLLGAVQVELVRHRGAVVWEAPSVPVNTSPPVVNGTLSVDSELTADPGTWSHAPTSFAYQWQVDDSGWVDVGGATSSTFTPTEEGDYRVRVIASNAVGDSEPAFSAPVTVEEADTSLTTFNPTGATSTAVLSDGNTVLSKPSGSAVAQCLTVHPISEKTYFEMRCTSAGSAVTGAQLYGGTSALIDYAPVGVWYEEPGCTIDVQQWSLSAYCNNNLPQAFSATLDDFNGANPATHDVYLAVDPATRAVWVSSDESPSGWYGGGDPASGTTPTFYVGGSAAIYGSAYVDTGRTVTLLHPDNFTRPTTPSGFRLGIAGS